MDSWSVTVLTGKKTKRSLYAAIREASKLDFVRCYSPTQPSPIFS